MQAVVIDSFGGPEVLQLREVPIPDPGPGQVRVKVTAAGINPVDVWNRNDGSWAGLTTPCILGYDVAGRVDSVGPGVSEAFEGQPVIAMTRFPTGGSGYAEFVVVDQELIALVKPGVDLVAAASIPLAAATALEVLARLQSAGSSMLVFGASGGVGLFLIQLATSQGVNVVGVGREHHHERMVKHGAAGCVDYRSPDLMSEAVRLNDGPFDSIADLVGGPLLAAAQPHLRHDGVMAAIATPSLDVDYAIDANQTFHGVLIRDNGDHMRRLATLFSDGALLTHVSHVLPLREAAKAHRLVESGEAGGKVVLTP